MTSTARASNGEAAYEREMPANVEAEQALLGALLLHNDAFSRVSDTLKEEYFREELHRTIYRTIANLVSQNRVASPITVKTFLGEVDLGGGLTPGRYLARLAAAATTTTNVRDYAQAVRDLAIRRDIISIAETIRDRAYDAPVEMSPQSIVDEFDALMGQVRPNVAESSEFEDFSNVLNEALERAATAYKRDGGIAGISTGIPRLDDAMGGLQRSDLIILAGRPGMGKTSLATNIAYNVARAYEAERDGEGALKTIRGGIVGFFSLEMSRDQLAARILSEQTGIPDWRIRRGKFNEGEFARYTDAARALQSIPLKIDHTGAISLAQIRMRARRLKKRRGLDILVIDYLGLIGQGDTGKRKNDWNRVNEVTEITGGLKALAKELQIPIIALAQLNRKVEERDDKRPMLSDLRESGSLEQDADVVMFVYREAYYLKYQKPKDEGSEAFTRWTAAMSRWEGVGEVIIGKQRHGPECTVELGWNGELTSFTNEPPERAPEPAAPEKAPRGPKEPTFSKKQVLNALGFLRNLIDEKGVESDGQLQGVPKYVKVVPYDIWRQVVVGSLCEPDEPEKGRAALMKHVVGELTHDQVMVRGGPGFGYVWLTAKGARR